LSAINQMQSGSPSPPAIVVSADVGAVSGNQYWILAGDPSLEPTGFFSDAACFNKATFEQPATGMLGQQPRNIPRTPGHGSGISGSARTAR
jgi:hypothetical protein